MTDFNKALIEMRKCKNMSKKIDNLTEEEILTLDLLYGTMLEKNGCYREAYEVLGNLLKRKRELLGEKHIDLIPPIAAMEILMTDTGKFDEASILKQEAIDLSMENCPLKLCKRCRI